MASSSSSSSTAAATTTMHHHRQGEGHGRIPAPPPPTPSNQSLHASPPTDVDAALSRFLNQLLITPKTLSLPRHPRRPNPPSDSSKPTPPPPPPPLISLLHRQQDLLLSAASDLGFFHVTDHGIPSHLPTSALLESRSLLHSTAPPASIRNRSSLGFDRVDGDDDDDSDGEDAFLVLDAGSGGLDGLPALQEYARWLERTGLEVVEMLSGGAAGGFSDNPFRKGGIRPRCLMWVSSSALAAGNEEGEEQRRAGWEESRGYPYVVCLQFEMKGWRNPCWVLGGDTAAWIPVVPRADSLLVTLGDIAQVWSNGRFKKVRGIPQPTSCESSNIRTNISMSLLVTLPIDTIIYPISPLASDSCGCGNDDDDDADEGDDDKNRFRAFSFDEYAWRVYHERLPSRDPLFRYRI